MLDPRFTFDRLRVGPHNRQVADAVRQVAEADVVGEPLVIYGPGGAGKTHFLIAAGHRARAADPERAVRYHALAEWAARANRYDANGDEFPGAGGLLLLDDVDALEGVAVAQLELLRVLGLAQRLGAQVIATCTRPPVELDSLDPRLRDRLSRGSLVKLAFPGSEPASGNGNGNGDGHGVGNGNGSGPLYDDADEFGAFLSDITSTVADLVEAAPWRRTVADAIRHWEAEGFRTRRLEALLDGDLPEDVDALVATFAAEAGAILQIERLLRELDPRGLLKRPVRDPDRLREAEDLLERARPAPVAAPLAATPAQSAAPQVDSWFYNPEKLVLNWVGVEERIVEDFA